ncbi:MAG: lysophospholipid acyltransferase family protein [Verrucomicrobia bacterium]|nr:lysophospholipid acyltransferase family protein [Verrucomicrobiota bacterium]MDA1085933.1 lysophospholipid acyltransferase family protein [Verrucomicrobiota bacterium]
MKSTKRLRQVLEGLLARLGVLVIPRLPRGAVVRLARVIGSAACAVCRRDQEVGRANLELALGATHSREERDKILHGAFVTFAQLILDLFWFSRDQQRRLEEVVEVDDSCRFFLDHPPCIALAAHFGNWEVMGARCAALGSPLTVVFAALENPVIDELVARLRRGSGQVVAEKTGVLRRLIRTLRDGGHIAVVLDQNTLPADGGRFVNFFGSPAPMSMAVASLSEKTSAPVVPTFCTRRPDGTYRVYHLPPLLMEQTETRESFTQRLATVLEGEIRKDPEQWLWMYKRWKFIPDDAEADRFPGYARRLHPGEKAAAAK